ncbi:hypothetical protein G7Y79_00032g067150 [Physcia stellaris]|nr:hypothetical protein G7Y79_00032g067150 [Physcia stellaris]
MANTETHRPQDPPSLPASSEPSRPSQSNSTSAPSPTNSENRAIVAIGSLPPELLHMVQDYLDAISATCFKHTNRYFRAALPPVPIIDKCTKWSIMCRFEQDMLQPPNTHRLACAFCKVARDIETFDVGASAAMQGKLLRYSKYVSFSPSHRCRGSS